jgi:hypothetical protein
MITSHQAVKIVSNLPKQTVAFFRRNASENYANQKRNFRPTARVLDPPSFATVSNPVER